MTPPPGVPQGCGSAAACLARGPPAWPGRVPPQRRPAPTCTVHPQAWARRGRPRWRLCALWALCSARAWCLPPSSTPAWTSCCASRWVLAGGRDAHRLADRAGQRCRSLKLEGLLMAHGPLTVLTPPAPPASRMPPRPTAAAAARAARARLPASTTSSEGLLGRAACQRLPPAAAGLLQCLARPALTAGLSFWPHHPHNRCALLLLQSAGPRLDKGGGSEGRASMDGYVRRLEGLLASGAPRWPASSDGGACRRPRTQALAADADQLTALPVAPDLHPTQARWRASRPWQTPCAA